MEFMKYDSPFMTGLRNIVSYVLLGLLWLAASMPVVTFGAATTAAFFTAEKSIRKGDEKILATFWTCFRREFKQATLLWLIGLVLIVVLGLNILFLWLVELHDVIYVLLLAVVLVDFGWMQLWFAYLSKFQDTTWVLLINTLRIAISKFPYVLLLIVLAAAAIVGLIVTLIHVSPLLLLIPGAYLMLAGGVFRRIFKAYLPAETTEDIPD